MQKRRTEKGQVSRRDFLMGAGAFVIGGAIGAGITYPLAACKEASSETNPTASLETSLEISNPVGDLATPIVSPAPRLDTLEGKKIGMYVARRANAFELTARIMEKLKEQIPTIELVGGVEGSIWAKPSYDRTAKEQGIWDGLIAENVDGIIMIVSS